MKQKQARQPALQKTYVMGWQEFPAQKPIEGQLVVMSFDGVGMFTHYYTDGLEENFRPFQKMRFIVLPPACP